MSREITQSSAQPIVSKEDLFTPFAKGCKDPQDFRIGLETEKIGVLGRNQPVPFEGQGIEHILKELAARYGWSPILDQGKWIALEKNKKAITLEPGGQLELSGEPHLNVHAVHDELMEHLEELKTVSDPLGITWLGVGIHPFATLEQIPWMPKSRYQVMKKYYEVKGGMAHQMMKMTASTQVNLDFETEQDARDKVRLGALLGPIVAAMVANSAVEAGAWNGYCSRRLQIWKHTDPDRSGTPTFFVDGTFSFEKYADYALKVPMYFVVRGGQYVDKTNLTFEDYMKTGEATVTDWLLHLTTLFPDVRVKTHLEFRTADATPPELTLSLVAFWVGLMYDKVALQSALELVKSLEHQDVAPALEDVSHKGLQAKIEKKSILELARELMHVSVLGLSRIDHLQSTSQVRYLDPLRNILEIGLSPAEKMRLKTHRTFDLHAFQV